MKTQRTPSVLFTLTSVTNVGWLIDLARISRGHEDPAHPGQGQQKLPLLILTDLVSWVRVQLDPKDPAHVGEGHHKLPLLMLTDLAGVLWVREDPALVSEGKHKLPLLMLTEIGQEYYKILKT